jgi:cysteine desulfurase
MDMLLKGILAAVPGSSVVGDRSRSVPHCVSVTFNGIDGETFLSGLARSGVAVSLGSACHGDPAAPSHVLTAAGLSAAAARRTIRFGLGRFTTVDDIEFALEQIGETISRIS